MKSPRSRLSAPRLWLSRRELVCRGEIVLQSHFSLDISARYFEIAPRSRLSRRDRVTISPRGRYLDAIFRNLAEMVVISPRSRRSWRDLGEIAAISPRATFLGAIFWNLAEIVAISPRSRRSRRDCRDLAEISVKFLQGSDYKTTTLRNKLGEGCLNVFSQDWNDAN